MIANWGILKRILWNSFTLWHARNEASLPFWSAERLQALQNRRVRSIVSHAYATVPFYREEMDRAGLHPRDFRTADDLSRLPFVTGDDLASAPERFHSRSYTAKNSLTLHTSGTSGRPKHCSHDHAALFRMMAYGHRQRNVLSHFLGDRLGYREMVVCPHWSVSHQLRHFYAQNTWIPGGIDFKRASLSPEGRIEDNIGRINEFKPDLIRGYGSYIGILFKEAYERGIPLHRPKAVLYGADCMTDPDRKLIECSYGVPVLSSYQSTEFLRIAYQCERRQGFHMNVDHVAVRIVDGSGRTLGPGERGEIIVSNLVNRATVLLNYKLGDIVTLESSGCTCGRTLPLLARIDGRTRDLIVLPDGEVLHALVFMPKLQSAPGVVRVQLMQHGVGHFTVRAVCTADTVWRKTREVLEQVMVSQFGSETRVAIERVDIIRADAGGKIRPFLSECNP